MTVECVNVNFFYIHLAIFNIYDSNIDVLLKLLIYGYDPAPQQREFSIGTLTMDIIECVPFCSK